MSEENNGEKKAPVSKYKQGKRTYKQIYKDGLKPQFKGAFKDWFIDMIAAGAGMYVGARWGRPSLLIGMGVNYLGHVAETPAISSFGIGMGAVNVFQGDPIATLNGVESTKKEKAQARLKSLKDDLYYKLYLDKIFKKKEETSTTTETNSGDAPVGEVKYFVYPGSESSVSNMDLTGLDEIENSILNSAMQYQQSNNMAESKPVQQSSPDFGNMGFVDPLY